VRRYDGSPNANGNDRIEALTMDASANIYVTGYSEGIGTQDDYATVKYSPAGTQLWANATTTAATTRPRPSCATTRTTST
jgi:hypothetical protein